MQYILTEEEYQKLKEAERQVEQIKNATAFYVESENFHGVTVVQLANLATIMQVITDVCNLTIEQLQEHSRKNAHVRARNLIMALLYQKGWTHAQAASVFGYHHSSSMHALKYCERKFQQKDTLFCEIYRKAIHQLSTSAK